MLSMPDEARATRRSSWRRSGSGRDGGAGPAARGGCTARRPRRRRAARRGRCDANTSMPMRWLEMKPWPRAVVDGVGPADRHAVPRERVDDVPLERRLGRPAEPVGGLAQVAARDEDRFLHRGRGVAAGRGRTGGRAAVVVAPMPLPGRRSWLPPQWAGAVVRRSHHSDGKAGTGAGRAVVTTLRQATTRQSAPAREGRSGSRTSSQATSR